jgi:predicted Fe-Mo cluster-binding NifX family protein
MEKYITLAFVTDDGWTISSHFGRALYYEVITLENGAITSRERRPKAGHHTFTPETAHDPEHLDAKHATMVSPVLDCSVLVARGMGSGAHTHLVSAGITPVLTDLQTIDEAVAAFVKGSLTNNASRLHDHGHHH